MEIRQSMEQLRREAAAHQDALTGGLAELTAMEFTARAGDGRVEVTVDGQGGLCAVRVDPDCLATVDGAELGASVVAAVQAARSAAAEAGLEMLERWSGGAAAAFGLLREGLGVENGYPGAQLGAPGAAG